MMDIPATAANPTPIRELQKRYTLALIIIAALIFISQVVVQRTVLATMDDSHIVNIAGRQSMLSQRIAKEVLILDTLPADQQRASLEALTSTLDLWEDSNYALQFGNAQMGLPGGNSALVNQLYLEAGSYLNSILSSGRCLVAHYRGTAAGDCAALTPDELRTTILTNEGPFLSWMDEIVFQYEAETTTAVKVIRLASAVLMFVTMISLLLEGRFIFRPIARRLQSTLDALHTTQRDLMDANTYLEQRVRERTQLLQQANAELQTANEEIRDYMSFVTHDLRSPIASVRGFLHELTLDLTDLRKTINGAYPSATALLEDSIPEAVTAIEVSNNQLDRLTHQLLDISRQGRRELDSMPVDLNTVLKQILQVYAPQIAESGAEVVIPAPLPAVESDPVLMEQVFTNVISNAIKYLDPTRRGKITLQAKNEKDRVVFSVGDNGRGIAPDDYDKVFKLFRRAGLQNTEGEGIGLYHVRNLLRRLGGTIWFESQVDSGTTFYFSIPNKLARGEA
ncbi:MAG: ATP-binding protein [Anaerolineae bacterium]